MEKKLRVQRSKNEICMIAQAEMEEMRHMNTVSATHGLPWVPQLYPRSPSTSKRAGAPSDALRFSSVRCFRLRKFRFGSSGSEFLSFVFFARFLEV